MGTQGQQDEQKRNQRKNQGSGESGLFPALNQTHRPGGKGWIDKEEEKAIEQGEFKSQIRLNGGQPEQLQKIGQDVSGVKLSQFAFGEFRQIIVTKFQWISKPHLIVQHHGSGDDTDGQDSRQKAEQRPGKFLSSLPDKIAEGSSEINGRKGTTSHRQREQQKAEGGFVGKQTPQCPKAQSQIENLCLIPYSAGTGEFG